MRPDGFDDVAAFNLAFEEMIRQHHSLEDSPLNRSLSGGKSTRELLDSDHLAANGFRQIIEMRCRALYRAESGGR